MGAVHLSRTLRGRHSRVRRRTVFQHHSGPEVKGGDTVCMVPVRWWWRWSGCPEQGLR